MSASEYSPDGARIITGSRGKTSTLRCKVGESVEECAKRHEEAGWDLPPGYKLGSDNSGPKLEWI